MNSTNQQIEVPVCTAKATVMIYDDANRKWQPSGSTGPPGISKVQLFQHTINNTYRVVGRKVQDHEVVINCSLAKGLKYNQANNTFLQWRDSKQVYGLNFQTKEEADTFTQALKTAVDCLNKVVSDIKRNNNALDSNYDETESRYSGGSMNGNGNGYNGSINNNNITNGSSSSSSNSNNNTMRNVVSSPQLIQQQSTNSQYQQRQSTEHTNAYQSQQQPQQQNYVDTNQKIYDVIPDTNYLQNGINKMNINGNSTLNNINNNGGGISSSSSSTVGGGGAPPPPPPPPPPPSFFSQASTTTESSQSSIGGGSLQQQILAPPPATPPISTATAAASTNGNTNMFAQQARNLKPVRNEENAKPMNLLEEIKSRIVKKNLMDQDQQQPSTINTTNQPKQIINSHIDSPKSSKKVGSASNLNQTNGIHYNGTSPSSSINGNNAHDNNINYDKLKNEILVELRKEIQSMKTDIINAIVSELRRANT